MAFCIALELPLRVDEVILLGYLESLLVTVGGRHGLRKLLELGPRVLGNALAHGDAGILLRHGIRA